MQTHEAKDAEGQEPERQARAALLTPAAAAPAVTRVRAGCAAIEHGQPAIDLAEPAVTPVTIARPPARALEALVVAATHAALADHGRQLRAAPALGAAIGRLAVLGAGALHGDLLTLKHEAGTDEPHAAARRSLRGLGVDPTLIPHIAPPRARDDLAGLARRLERYAAIAHVAGITRTVVRAIRDDLTAVVVGEVGVVQAEEPTAAESTIVAGLSLAAAAHAGAFTPRADVPTPLERRAEEVGRAHIAEAGAGAVELVVVVDAGQALRAAAALPTLLAKVAQRRAGVLTARAGPAAAVERGAVVSIAAVGPTRLAVPRAVLVPTVTDAEEILAAQCHRAVAAEAHVTHEGGRVDARLGHVAAGGVDLARPPNVVGAERAVVDVARSGGRPHGRARDVAVPQPERVPDLVGRDAADVRAPIEARRVAELGPAVVLTVVLDVRVFDVALKVGDGARDAEDHRGLIPTRLSPARDVAAVRRAPGVVCCAADILPAHIRAGELIPGLVADLDGL